MTCEPKTTEDILDLIDIKSHMHMNIEIHELMNHLSSLYDGTKLTSNKICSGLLFNNMDDFEFEQYLRRRYKNIGFYEYTQTFIRWQQ